MYCFPIYINDKFYVSRLVPIQIEDQDSIPCYILERKTKSQNELPLLRILPESGVFDPSKGMSSDFSVCIEKIELRRSEDGEDDKTHTIIITLQRINEQQETEPNCPEGISYDSEGFLRINYTQLWPKNPEVSSIYIELKYDNCRAKYRFNIALPANIYDIILDYGSEASQMWVSSRVANLEPSDVNCQANLFEAIKNGTVEDEVRKLKETLGENKVQTSTNSPSEDFYQYDQSDPHLFRTRFFIRSKNNSYINEDSILQLNVKADLLSVLDDRKYKELPNLKLSDYPDVRMPEVLINKNTTYNVYHEIPKLRKLLLTSMIRAGLSQHGSLQSSDEQRVCKVILLTPNTYSQENLTAVRYNLVKALNTLDYKKINPRLVQGIEVSTFSESDASFFGWYDPEDPKLSSMDSQGKKILIIDIGKGTSDFSVLNLNLNKETSKIEAERIARSGIVGAGSLMTFALLISILVQIIKQKKWDEDASQQQALMIKNKLDELIKTGDRSKRNRLLLLLDTLKCMPKAIGRKPFAEGIAESENFKNLNKFEELEITGIISILEGLLKKEAYFVPADDEVLRGYAVMIAQNLETELTNVYDENIPIDQLLLMGRGANNDALVNAIFERLKQKPKNGSMTLIRVPRQRLKSACLIGPLNKSVTCSSDGIDVLSWPLPRKDEFHVTRDQKDLSQRFEEGKKRFLSLFDLSTRKNKAGSVAHVNDGKRSRASISKSDGNTTWVKKVGNIIYTICTGNRKSGTDNQSKPTIPKKEPQTKASASMDLYYGGQQNVIKITMGNLEGQTRFLQIGNRQYICDEMNNVESSIFFDGERFILRNDDKSATLTQLRRRTSGSTLIFESMYPDVTLASEYSHEFTERLTRIVLTNKNNKSDDGNDF